MAASREPRATAGNRMARVLEEECEEDDFYKTTYGGFNEEEEDDDFKSDQEDSADEVDSDFDRPEEDDVNDDGNDDVDKPKRRKKGVDTKAYKEPAVTKKVAVKKEGGEVDKKNIIDDQLRDVDKSDKPMTRKEIKAINDLEVRKSSRRATAKNSLMTNLRKKEREESDKKKKEMGKKAAVGVRRLTQEELLAEAERTERKNLKSLENFQKLEASRRKTTTKKRTFEGVPTIKYLSLTMPSVDSIVRRDGSDEVEVTSSSSSSRVARNFLIFSDDATCDAVFRWRRPRAPLGRRVCPVTNLPARYIDPLTRIAYHDARAFKEIRAAYRLTLKEIADAGGDDKKAT